MNRLIFRKHKATKIFRRVLSFVVLLSVALAFPAQAEAATVREMRIHAIWHGNGNGNANFNGEAVLVESRGHYLLMDTAMPQATRRHVIPYMHSIADGMPGRRLIIDVYISHFHEDHYGGLNEILNDDRILVNRVHLPDIEDVRWVVDGSGRRVPHERQLWREERARNWVTNAFNRDERDPENARNAFAAEPINPLKVGSRIRFGDARLDVIGPVGSHLQNYRALLAESRRLGLAITHELRDNEVYTNNYSLVSMITCGTIKYLTAGDIEGRSYRISNAMKREEDHLIDKHGRKLRADILKLSRHGAHPSNTAAFLRRVNPSYTFLANNVTNHANIRSTWDRATDRSVCYMIGSEQRTLIFSIRNNNISLFRGSQTSANRLRGLVRLRGFPSDTKISAYFIRNNSRESFTGFRRVPDVGMAYFSRAGAMLRGGFRRIDGNWYHFANNGRRTSGGFRTIDNHRYHFANNGKISTGVRRIDGNIYWFSNRGRMQRNRSIGEYEFGADGVLQNPPRIGRVREDSLRRRGTRNITVRWEPVSGVNGYEIQYADNPEFKGRTSVIARGGNTNRSSFSVPRGAAAAHIRIRSYVTIGSSRVYSGFTRV